MQKMKGVVLSMSTVPTFWPLTARMPVPGAPLPLAKSVSSVMTISVNESGASVYSASKVAREEFPDLDVLPVVADFTQPFQLPSPKVMPVRNIVYFPGSTIGNFEHDDALGQAQQASLTSGPLDIAEQDLEKQRDNGPEEEERRWVIHTEATRSLVDQRRVQAQQNRHGRDGQPPQRIPHMHVVFANEPDYRQREEHAEHTADEHDGRSVAEVEFVPRAADHERRDGEDGPGHQRFTHRGCCPGDVLLENIALENTKGRHGDHGGREGGGNRQSDLHPEIRVGRTEDDRHDDTEKDRLEGQLRHG